MPSSLAGVQECFPLLYRTFPELLIDLISEMPLDEEPQMLSSTDWWVLCERESLSHTASASGESAQSSPALFHHDTLFLHQVAQRERRRFRKIVRR